MESLRKYLENYTWLPENEWQIISSFFEKRIFARNEILVNEGTVCRYFFFLEKGLIRYYFNNDGIEVTKYFTIAPYCFTSKDSFREQLPAKESIEALDDCVVWQINHQQANQLLKLNSWNEFTRKFLHEVQSYFEQQLLDVRSITAEERYLKLLETHPNDIDKIPLKHLSSYLGIAPQSLSRIRKKRNFNHQVNIG